MKIGNVVKIKIGVIFGYWYNLKYCYMDIIIMLIILKIKSWFMIWFKKKFVCFMRYLSFVDNIFYNNWVIFYKIVN